MTDDKPKESQEELFPEFSPLPKKPERLTAFTKTHKPLLFSTTLEQMLMVSIVAILVLCGVFFLGVLRGKALRPLPQPPVRLRSAPAPSPLPLNTTPAAPAPVRLAAVPATTSDKPYTIQVVTHRKREYAENEVAAVRKMGYFSFVITRGEYFYVCAGQYASREEAKRDLALLATKYKDCFLRPR